MKLHVSSIRRWLYVSSLVLAVIGTAQFAHGQSDLTVRPADPLAVRVELTARGINYVWTLLAAFLVMFMQAGFALMETGMCRAKNAAHIMSMNFLVYALGMAAFFVCGFALMCGGVNDIPGGAGGPAALGLDHISALHAMI